MDSNLNSPDNLTPNNTNADPGLASPPSDQPPVQPAPTTPIVPSEGPAEPVVVSHEPGAVITPQATQPIAPQPSPETMPPQVNAAPQVFHTQDSASSNPAPMASPVVNSSDMGAPQNNPAPQKKRRFNRKIALPTMLAVIIIFGGSAAAYFGVVVPNKPANVLKSALINSAKTPPSNLNGLINVTSKSVKVDVSLSASHDTDNNNFDLNINPTVSANGSGSAILGALSSLKINPEVKMVNKNLYFTLGDLSTVKNFVSGIEPSLDSEASTLSSQFSNKWIEVDSSVVNKGTLACVLNTKFMLNNSDINMLESDYSKNPFLIINSHSNSTVNGVSSESFVISSNKTKSKAFNSNLDKLSLVKELDACGGSSVAKSVDSDASTSTNTGSDTITISVDKSTKEIDQIAVSDTDKGTVSSIKFNLGYGNVNITAPSNAISYTQALSELQSDYSGLSSSLGSSSSLPSFQSLTQDLGSSFDQGFSTNTSGSTTITSIE